MASRLVRGATLALLALGCRPAERSRTDSANSAVPPRAGPAAAAAQPRPASPWVVSDSGAGVLRIGMTRDQLARDLHEGPPAQTKADSGCAYLDVHGLPAGMRTMWVAATLARIEILSPQLPTDRGAKVGDSQARIDSLYRGRATTMPAKYDSHGSYIVIRSGSPMDSSRRIVFETDSTHRVTRYRVGRVPEVEWVEGCG